jgi:predicted CopG family antitoxin
MSSRKMIAISEKTYHRLAELGNLEDSFDSVIARLLQKQKTAFGPNSRQETQGQKAAAPLSHGGNNG